MRESRRLRSSNSSRLHRAFAPIASPPCTHVRPRPTQSPSRVVSGSRSGRLTIGTCGKTVNRPDRKICASTPYTGPWSRSSTRYRARVSPTLNSNRNSVAGLNGRAPLTYMRSPHSEHSMCSSPVVSVTRVTSWLHHHVSFLHSRFIIALPLSANRGLRPQT